MRLKLPVLVILAVVLLPAPAAAQRAQAAFVVAVDRLMALLPALGSDDQAAIRPWLDSLHTRAENLDAAMVTWRRRVPTPPPTERPDADPYMLAARQLIDALLRLPDPTPQQLESMRKVLESAQKAIDQHTRLMPVQPIAGARVATAVALEQPIKGRLMRAAWALYGELSLMYDELDAALATSVCTTAPLAVGTLTWPTAPAMGTTISTFVRLTGTGPVAITFDWTGPRPTATFRNRAGCVVTVQK
jgi:hypothetical protein